MHCISMYPTPLEKINLDRVLFVANSINPHGHQEGHDAGEWGVSDHSLGTNFSKVAICHGATWVEKHFTIDNKLVGPDNYMSITPSELKIIRDFSDDYVKIKSFDTTKNNHREGACPDVYPEELEVRKVYGDRFSKND